MSSPLQGFALMIGVVIVCVVMLVKCSGIVAGWLGVCWFLLRWFVWFSLIVEWFCL